MDVLEKEMGEFQLLMREFASLESTMHAILEHRKRNASEVERIEREILALEKEIEGKEVFDLDKDIASKKAEAAKREIDLKKVHHQMHSLMTRMEQSEETARKVALLENCPLCQQQVTHDHKKSITETEARKQQEWKGLLDKEKGGEQKASQELALMQKDIEVLRKRQNEMAAVSVKVSNLARRKAERLARITEQESLKKELGAINVKKLDLTLQIEQKKDAQAKFQAVKKELDAARHEEHKAAITHATLKKELEGNERMRAIIQKDIIQKEEAIGKLKKIRGVQEWLSQFFMNLMQVIERHVMLQINREFNEYFKNWFSTLMEDETLSVRLNDDFSPVIEQNGYETFIENLSGGEKTSVALAYRLALNKVINDIVSEIKTKGILMLDEPTDGFSTEQLDKVREVLEALHIEQIVIVSHEAKIESFVDKVIRITKQEHVSRVIA